MLRLNCLINSMSMRTGTLICTMCVLKTRKEILRIGIRAMKLADLVCTPVLKRNE